MPSGKNPIVIKEFKGELLTDVTFASGVGQDQYRQSQVPFEYSLNNENLFYAKKGGLYTRPGVDVLNPLALTGLTGAVKQFWRIDNLNGVDYQDRFLIFTWDSVNGRLYDTNPAVATNPLMVVTGMKYVYVINAFGRMYISPWSDWATPLANAYCWIYNDKYAGAGNGVRLTMVQEPIPGAMAVAAAATGTDPACTAGLHLVSVVFETDSGFLSTCPTSHIKAPLQVTTTTANGKINVTNIPTFPGVAGSWPAATVIARHLIMSKVVVNFDQNGFDSYEPFIVATINDNTTTSFSIHIPDSGMVNSAKDLINQSQSGVRTHVGMAIYKGRMVWLGSRSFTGGDTFGLVNSVTYSPINRPEQLRNVLNDGLRVVVGADFSGRVMAGAELNGTFYIFKEDSTFAHIADDQSDPTDWAQPSLVDAGKGAFPNGIATVGNNPSNLMDNYILVAGNHGLSLFNGAYSQNSLADAIWEKFNTVSLRWIKVVVDPIRKLMFLRFGDPIAAEGSVSGPKSYIYFADYYYGLQNLRWGKFVFPNIFGTSTPAWAYDILLRQPDSGISSNYIALYSLLTTLVHSIIGYDAIYSETVLRADYSLTPTDIPWKYETGYTPNNQGEIYECGPVKLRANIRSNNTPFPVTIKKSTIDKSALDTVGILSVNSDPAKYYSLPMNELSEQIRLEVSGAGAILIQALILFMNQSALERPRP